jgi:hypothetical protein
MSQDKKREPVHYGYLSRRLMACLPDVDDREDFIAPTIQALFAFSDSYLTKEDLEAGKISFSGTASFDQLAVHMKVAGGWDTAKWRCEEVRDRWGILTWKRSKHGINYKVAYRGKHQFCMRDEEDGQPICVYHGHYQRVQLGEVNLEDCWVLQEIGNRLPESEKIQIGNLLPISETSQVMEAPSQVMEAVEIGNGGSEIGNPHPPLSLSVLKTTVDTVHAEDKDVSKEERGIEHRSTSLNALSGETPEPPAVQSKGTKIPVPRCAILTEPSPQGKLARGCTLHGKYERGLLYKTGDCKVLLAIQAKMAEKEAAAKESAALWEAFKARQKAEGDAARQEQGLME